MVKIIQGDALEVLRGMADESVHCCVTSPPYWGLRNYGTATWEGGDSGCDHIESRKPQSLAKLADKYAPRTNPRNPNRQDDEQINSKLFKDICAKCGARRIDQQLGLEKTPEEYVTKMVEVFREVRRVLRNDGVAFINIGDSYAGRQMTGGNNGINMSGGINGFKMQRQFKKNTQTPTCKPKDLIGIPWMLAFALRADGWYLRQDIVWCLSGGTWLYARTQKGDMPIMVRDLSRLNPATVELWNGKKWTRLLGMNKSKRSGDEIEIVLRSGERISCTPAHKWPTRRGLIDASELRIGDVLDTCQLPEPYQPRTPRHIGLDAAWFAGLYLAEGSMSGDCIQIAGHCKENDRLQRVGQIAKDYGGSMTYTKDGNKQNIRVYGKMLCALLSELVTGRTAKDKGIAPPVWRYSNEFLAAMIDGYLSGDGHWDESNQRWRLGFCRNYNLERDLRAACARLGYTLTLKMTVSEYQGGSRPSFRGELRKNRNWHFNQRERSQIVEIRKARCREVYDLGVEDDPHVFALASGVLTHNSKPNPMPESVRDRCTKSHEYIFLLSKSQRYYYDAEAIAEKSINDKWNGGCVGGEKYKNVEFKPQSGREYKPDGNRNKRSVWTVATSHYPGSHFATFPPKLIEPCILAGCPDGGTVLDPFGGSGTVGMVAEENGRHSILIELNPKYVDMAKRRTAQQGLFA